MKANSNLNSLERTPESESFSEHKVGQIKNENSTEASLKSRINQKIEKRKKIIKKSKSFKLYYIFLIFFFF